MALVCVDVSRKASCPDAEALDVLYICNKVAGEVVPIPIFPLTPSMVILFIPPV